MTFSDLTKNILLAILSMLAVVLVATEFGCSSSTLQSVNDIECTIELTDAKGAKKSSFLVGDPIFIQLTETNIRSCDIAYSQSNCLFCDVKIYNDRGELRKIPSQKGHDCNKSHQSKNIGSEAIQITEVLLAPIVDPLTIDVGSYTIVFTTAIHYPELQESKSYAFEIPLEVYANEDTAEAWFDKDSFQRLALH